MKVFFITSSFCIIWYMRHHRIVSQTYDREQDTFRVAFLVVPCIFLALLVNHEFSMVEVLWTFSIYLESVAILPQLILLQRTFNVDTLTSNYVFLLGAYRALYMLNWLYRYFTEPGYSQWIVWSSGTLQTAIYCDFFYYYVVSWRKNERLSLPSWRLLWSFVETAWDIMTLLKIYKMSEIILRNFLTLRKGPDSFIRCANPMIAPITLSTLSIATRSGWMHRPLSLCIGSPRPLKSRI